jgi:lauroyl/myristoyl acyltransferase
VLLTPHLGCFEVCAQAIAERFGHRMRLTVMYRPARQPWLRQLEETARQRPGLATVPAALAGVRQMIRALRRGEAVGLLPDQVPPEGMGVWAPFFGRPAYTMTLAARLVQQTGAAPLLIWAERLAGGAGWRVHVSPASPLPQAAADDEALQVACATTVNQDMERLIARCPGQYLWGYDRYKQPRRAHRVTGEEAAAMIGELAGARLVHGLLRVVQWLPLGVQAALGRGLGAVLFQLAGSRRRIALRNWNCACPNWMRGRAPAPGARPLRLAGAQPAGARPAVVRQRRAAEDADPRGRRRRLGRAQRQAGDVAGAALPGAGRGRRGGAAVPDAAGRLDLPGAEQPGVRRRDAGRAACASARPSCSPAASGRCRWCAPSAAAAPSSTCRTWTSA